MRRQKLGGLVELRHVAVPVTSSPRLRHRQRLMPTGSKPLNRLLVDNESRSAVWSGRNIDRIELAGAYPCKNFVWLDPKSTCELGWRDFPSIWNRDAVAIQRGFELCTATLGERSNCVVSM